MSSEITAKELASLMGISTESLRRRIRFGTIQKAGLECKKNSYGFYVWDRKEAEEFARKFPPPSKLSDDIRTALSIVRRIKGGWPYDTDNEVYISLRPEAKQLILDALKDNA